jgi:anaerobic magnesium-protoporphyrin IX monomethyl ester cyclase
MPESTKTVLVNPAWHCLQNHRTFYMPLGLAYVAGTLTSEGHEVEIVDGDQVLAGQTIDSSIPAPGILVSSIDRYVNFHDPGSPIYETLAKAILAGNPRIVGFTVWTASFQSVINTANVLKRLRPDLIIVAGGIHATIDPAGIMEQPSIDFVICGEGETAAKELWALFASSPDPFAESKRIPGVWTRINGCVWDGGKTPLIDRIDDLPFPNYDGVRNFSLHNIAGIITSRGCPFGCSFCASESIWTRKVRYRGIDACLDELAYYRDRFDLRSFRINDDTFCLKKARVQEFCSKLVERFGNTWEFMVDANADSLDPEKIRLLKQAGCRQVNFGIESVAPRIQKLFVNKKVNRQHAKEMVEAMYAAGITSGAYFMTGFPGETEEELETTVTFMEELTATENIWSIVSPYPGTPLHRYSMQNGYLPQASGLHLMHHSLSTNMAAIEPARYTQILERIEQRVASLANYSRLKMKLVDLLDCSDGAAGQPLDLSSVPNGKHCGYVDELVSTVNEWSASGWAYYPAKLAPADKVLVLHNGIPLGSVPVHFERSDVARALGSELLERSGWRAIIPAVSPGMRSEELDFVAISDRQVLGYLNNAFKQHRAAHSR